MSSRKRVAAPARRAPVRRRAPLRPKRRAGPKGAPNAAGRLPHHLPYTPALLAQIRARFETTPEPIPSMAADLGVAPGSLHRIARRNGWVRRNPVPPPRDVSQATRILQEAEMLASEASTIADVAPDGAANHLSPLAGRGRPPERSEGGRVRGAFRESELVENPPHPDPLPASGERERAEFAEPPSTELSTIERLERAVLAELATIEAMRAAMGTLPQKPVGAARTVRTLNMLTQTLQHLQRLRASAALAEKPIARDDHDDDDMPADIDEFRRDLARRIDAFVASRTERSDADGDPAARAVDEAR